MGRPPPAALLVVALALCLAGCAGLPRGADYPRPVSVALAEPETTRLGRQFLPAAQAHGGNSGFRLLTLGMDGFLAREQLIDAAERTIDLQYYIFRGDETGRLLTAAVLRAADRGVRVRILVDDGETLAGDEQLFALDGHPGIEIRVFNPFDYRGHHLLFRAIDFLVHMPRLDYRMHNKLLVVDNAVALVGGRNIANEYFQVDPQLQFADDDVFAAGPIAARLSATFDEFWNSGLAIPAAAFEPKAQRSKLPAARPVNALSDGPLGSAAVTGIDYAALAASGEPLAGLLSGRLPLVWAPAQVVADSPYKKDIDSGARRGRLMEQVVVAAAAAVRGEFDMTTPYFVPARDELALLARLRGRGVRVRLLTTALESSTDLVTQAAYERVRRALLAEGVEIHELRSLIGNARGSGESARLARYGNYSLHAKLFVFDAEAIFIGSMNLDQRSKHLNTEVGLIIRSPELALQLRSRFEAMTQPENAYSLALRAPANGGGARIVWSTVVAGNPVTFTREPARHAWQRLATRLLSYLPIRGEL